MTGPVHIEVKGVQKALDAIGDAALLKKKKILKAVKTAGYLVQGTARKKILRDSKTGRVYGGKQASAPGEAPANQTGNLARSIQVSVDALSESATVSAGADYAQALELGSYRKVGNAAVLHVAARPFMAPALNMNREAIIDLISEALQ